MWYWYIASNTVNNNKHYIVYLLVSCLYTEQAGPTLSMPLVDSHADPLLPLESLLSSANSKASPNILKLVWIIKILLYMKNIHCIWLMLQNLTQHLGQSASDTITSLQQRCWDPKQNPWHFNNCALAKQNSYFLIWCTYFCLDTVYSWESSSNHVASKILLLPTVFKELCVLWNIWVTAVQLNHKMPAYKSLIFKS